MSNLGDDNPESTAIGTTTEGDVAMLDVLRRRFAGGGVDGAGELMVVSRVVF